jgi:hypothetical protein
MMGDFFFEAGAKKRDKEAPPKDEKTNAREPRPPPKKGVSRFLKLLLHP